MEVIELVKSSDPGEAERHQVPAIAILDPEGGGSRADP